MYLAITLSRLEDFENAYSAYEKVNQHELNPNPNPNPSPNFDCISSRTPT